MKKNKTFLWLALLPVLLALLSGFLVKPIELPGNLNLPGAQVENKLSGAGMLAHSQAESTATPASAEPASENPDSNEPEEQRPPPERNPGLVIGGIVIVAIILIGVVRGFRLKES